MVQDQVGTARPEIPIYSMRCRTGSQCRTSIISLYLMTWGHTGHVSPIIEKRPCFHQLLAPSPNNLVFPNILDKSAPVSGDLIVIVIVNSKLLKRQSKAKPRAPAYSRALRQIREVFQRIVRGRLRSVFQRVREWQRGGSRPKEGTNLIRLTMKAARPNDFG